MIQWFLTLDFGFSVLGIFGLSFVFDVGDVSAVVGRVGDDLGAAIGQGNAVGSGDHFGIGTLVMVVVAGTLTVGDGVAVDVRHRRLHKKRS